MLGAQDGTAAATYMFASIGESNKAKSMSPEERLLALPVKDWSTDDVQNWLKYLPYTGTATLYDELATIMLQNDMDGNALKSLLENESEFAAIGITKIGLQTYLKRYIREAPEKRIFELLLTIV